MLDLQDGRCGYCREPTECPDGDHVVPLALGGADSIDNIVPACQRCNTSKGTLTLDEWAVSRERRGMPALDYSWPRPERMAPSS